MDRIIAQLDDDLIAGMTYTTPGATTEAREESGYCLQPGSHCHTCCLVNYGLDCRNNEVEDDGGAACCRRCLAA